MQYLISSDSHNVRLDRFLRKRYKKVPLAAIFRMIRKGTVTVNGKKAKQDYRLQTGDTLWINIDDQPTATPFFVPLSPSLRQQVAGWIVWESDQILLCCKPPGLVMHKGSRHNHGMTEMVRSFTQLPDFAFVHRERDELGLLQVEAERQHHFLVSHPATFAGIQ
jgi:23S rRNA pseudouridine955/2504/2580 synthase